ncbi:VOC family protein [Pseudohoeflea coraliihabitans]|uniref:VOC family protein n=1 Tax=Pseudohoeflea coraliihabitans TaxID=2860393 RepID=A0ABS6WR96_9HYPH|nr:VOC family protein [Pseudohoeflea sp. DP4N28-3]MBW3098473.1 VOC family protein [Pseudohoeflea sp. DP4N28-3]
MDTPTASRQRTARRLDHLVLPVADLATTRKRHTALGFQVAPDARHPFGTENACIFFGDGSYLEPLAIASREECEAAAIAGNVFVARDQAFRFRQGAEGLSALVVSSSDAGADHARFAANGQSGGEILTFTRPLERADGSTSHPRFELAFAADLRAPDFFGVAVERHAMPPAADNSFARHANGVTGISELVLSEPNPTDFQYFLQELADNREVDAHSFGIEIALQAAVINVMTPEGLENWFGTRRCAHGRGLRGRAVVFRVADLNATRSALANEDIPVREHAGRLIVDAAEGQGVLYAFEESR